MRPGWGCWGSVAGAVLLGRQVVRPGVGGWAAQLAASPSPPGPPLCLPRQELPRQPRSTISVATQPSPVKQQCTPTCHLRLHPCQEVGRHVIEHHQHGEQGGCPLACRLQGGSIVAQVARAAADVASLAAVCCLGLRRGASMQEERFRSGERQGCWRRGRARSVAASRVRSWSAGWRMQPTACTGPPAQWSRCTDLQARQPQHALAAVLFFGAGSRQCVPGG